MSARRTRGGAFSRAWRGAGRGVGFELTLLAVAMLALGAAIVATLRASMRDPGDLQFGAAREAIGDLVRERGGEGLVAVVRVREASAGGVVAYDTLALTGDTLRLPALARGGFVRDEVVAYNDAAIRNAWRPTTVGAAAREEVELPSLFRLVRTDSGTLEVSQRLNPYRHNVPAPGELSTGVRVLAADWRRGPSVVGLHGEAAQGAGNRPGDEPQLVSYGRCRVIPDSLRASLVYCGVSPGITLGRQFDLRVGMGRDTTLDGVLQLTENRQAALSLNGARATPPVAARAGDIVYTARMGPVTLTESETGWLAGPQWVNGRAAYHVAARGSLRAFARAGRSLRETPEGGALPLTLDAGLTAALDEGIASYADSNSALLDRLSVSVMDLSTGALLAIAESGASAERALLAFEPVLVGSMSKPLLAAAILSRQPGLATMTLRKAPTTIEEVSGLRLFKPLGNPDNRCPALIDLTAYLGCSSNQYAAELLVRSLQRRPGDRGIAVRGRVADGVLEGSALSEGLLDLYDDVLLTSDAPPSRSARPWLGGAGGTDSSTVPRDLSLRPYLSRPAFIDPDTAGVPIDWLARFAIGGWENRWTLVGALEGYARIATDRRVRLSVVAPPPGAETRGAAMRPEATQAFRAVRRGLRAVATTGTAGELDAALGGLAGKGGPLVVMAKTGTLNEDAGRAGDAGVFLKSLAVTVGRPTSSAESAPMRCGIGVIVYVQFRQDWQSRSRLSGESKLPDLHRRFATGALARALRGYWQRHDPCRGAAPASDVRPDPS
jgi:hypothetical protein